MQSCNVEPGIVDDFKSLASGPTRTAVGFLFGRPNLGTRTAVFACIPSQDEDGQKAARIDGGKLRLWTEKLEGEAEELLRMSVGGVTVVGVYACGPREALASAHRPLRTLVAHVAAAAAEYNLPCMLHPVMLTVDSASAAMTAYLCSASTETAAQLKPCELKTVALLPTFRLVTAALPVDVDRAVREGECASLAAAVSEAVRSAGTRAQCARFLPPAPAAATPVGDRTAVKQVLGSEAGAQGIRLRTLLPLACEATGAGAAPEAGTAAGRLRLQGQLVACALVQSHDDWSTLTSLLQSDADSSMTIRLSYSADAAADTDMLQGHEPGARERIEGGFLLDKSSEGVAGLAAMALRLPSRVLIRCQSGQLPLCEYQSPASAGLAEVQGSVEATLGSLVEGAMFTLLEAAAVHLAVDVGIEQQASLKSPGTSPVLLGYLVGLAVLLLAILYMFLLH